MIAALPLRWANAVRALRYFARHGRWCRHEEMGSWWPCDLGAAEVRMCSARDRIEKRPAG